MSSEKRYYKSVEVLEAIFALPDDVEDSEDDREDSDSITSVVADKDTVMQSDFEADDDSNCSSTLYQLADDYDHSNSSALDVSEEDASDSDDEEGAWKKGTMNDVNIDFDTFHVVPAKPFSPDDGPTDFFCKFFNDEVFELLITQTNLYAAQTQILNWKDVTVEEMRAFIGMLIGMGMHEVPSLDMFWSSDPLFGVPPIVAVMSRDRFKKILQGLHLNDNSKTPGRGDTNFDKLYKVRPLLDLMNNQFQTQSVTSSSMSIDEAMILFKGRSSLKQYMPLKPTKRGYKAWVRADSKTGYVFQFQIYTGKEEGGTEVGLGARVVKNLSESLKNMNAHLTFDNFFTSSTLLEDLQKQGIYATGTVRSNRKDLPVLARRKINMNRGEMKWRIKENTSYVLWMDTKLVNVLSTAFSPIQVRDINRKLKDGSTSKVQCPEPIIQYTRRMGGVDRFDQKRGYYSVSRKSRRWWLRIFYFMLDAAVVNAHILYTSVHPEDKFKQIDFRTNLFRGLVANYSSKVRCSGPQVTFVQRRRHKSSMKPSRVPDTVRTKSVGVHMPALLDKFQRCRLCSTKTYNKRSRIQCSKCKVPLCVIPCFGNFHK